MRNAGQGVLNILAIGGVKDRSRRGARARAVPRTRRRAPARRPACALSGPNSSPAGTRPTPMDADQIDQPHELSPLDAAHRRLGAKMVPFGGWEMPLSYAAGTIDEHLACRNDAVVFDVSHLGTVRVEGADADERLQWALTNDLAQGRARAGRSTRTCSTRSTARCSTTSSCGGSTTRSSTSCRTPPTPIGSARAIGGTETTHGRAVLAVQGPKALRTPGSPCSPMPRPSAASASPAAPGNGVECTVAGTGYTGERRRRDRRARRRCGRPVDRDRRRRHHAGRARRPRHASPRSRHCRCTDTNSAPASRRCRPVSAGSSRWPRTSSAAGTR